MTSKNVYYLALTKELSAFPVFHKFGSQCSGDIFLEKIQFYPTPHPICCNFTPPPHSSHPDLKFNLLEQIPRYFIYSSPPPFLTLIL